MMNSAVIMNRSVDEVTSSNYSWTITYTIGDFTCVSGIAKSREAFVNYFVHDDFFQEFDMLISIDAKNELGNATVKLFNKYNGELRSTYTATFGLPVNDKLIRTAPVQTRKVDEITTTSRIMTDVSMVNNAAIPGDNPPW